MRQKRNHENSSQYDIPQNGDGERHWRVIEVPEADVRETPLMRMISSLRRRFWGAMLLLMVFALVGLSSAGAAKQQLSASKTNVLRSQSNENKSGQSSADGDAALLASCVEAYGADANYRAKVAIGAVVLNRVADASFPNTIADVLYQTNAFPTAIATGVAASEESLSAARDALNGWDPSGSALFFYDRSEPQEEALLLRTVTVDIDDLRFCR